MFEKLLNLLTKKTIVVYFVGTSSSFLKFYVHYDRNYDNAFFDGDSFKFGDGYVLKWWSILFSLNKKPKYENLLRRERQT